MTANEEISVRTHRLPIIQQSEAAECGLASLAMVMNYYGYEVDMATLRRENQVSLQGCTFADIARMAGKYNLEARGVKVELQHIAELDMPCILHWDLNHFVVLKSWKNGKATIHDPAFGARTYTQEEIGKHYTGVALELYPSQDFQKTKKKREVKLSYFFKNTKGLYGTLFQIFLFAFVLQICGIVTPFYMQWVTDEVLVSYDEGLLIVLSVGFFLLLLFQVGIGILRSYISLYLSSRVSLRLGSNVLTHLLQLPMSYFEKRHMGDLQSRFGSTANIQSFITQELVDMSLNAFIMVAMIVMVMIYDWLLGIVVLAAILLYALMRTLMYFKFKQVNYEYTLAEAKRETVFMETMRAMQTLKLYGKENDRRVAWTNRATTTMNLEIERSKMAITFETFKSLLFGIENILVIYFGATAIMDGNMTIGVLLAFISYKQQLEGAAGSLIEQFVSYRMISIHLDRLSDILLTEKDNRLVGKAGLDVEPDGSFSVSGVYFRHKDTDPYLLENVSMEVAPGETVAIIGPSGCGKTTFMKILVGLLYPDEGEMFLGKVSQSEMGTRKYRTHIATVMQDDQLLSGSILENIAFFDPEPDINRVMAAAKIANIEKDINAMPMQFNTLVGDMGTTLSGGQKQRLLLARAVYKRPKYLFLDESTSHLDPRSELEVNKNMTRMSVTTILIAHRRETIAAADRVLQLDKGKLMDVTKQYK